MNDCSQETPLETSFPNPNQSWLTYSRFPRASVNPRVAHRVNRALQPSAHSCRRAARGISSRDAGYDTVPCSHHSLLWQWACCLGHLGMEMFWICREWEWPTIHWFLISEERRRQAKPCFGTCLFPIVTKNTPKPQEAGDLAKQSTHHRTPVLSAVLQQQTGGHSSSKRLLCKLKKGNTAQYNAGHPCLYSAGDPYATMCLGLIRRMVSAWQLLPLQNIPFVGCNETTPERSCEKLLAAIHLSITS